jgi:hypothetical protein
MSSTVEQAVERMDQLTAIVVEATVAEMRAAAYAIARQTREQHPAAVRVHLEASDQGDWLDATGWDAGDEVEDLDLPEEVAFAAAHLYIPHIGNGDHTGAVPGLRYTDRRRGIFVLDVDRVLADCDQDPVAGRGAGHPGPGRAQRRRPSPSWVAACSPGRCGSSPSTPEPGGSGRTGSSTVTTASPRASEGLQEPLRAALGSRRAASTSRAGTGRTGSLGWRHERVDRHLHLDADRGGQRRTGDRARGQRGRALERLPGPQRPEALEAHAAVWPGDADLPVILGAVGGLRLAMYQHRTATTRRCRWSSLTWTGTTPNSRCASTSATCPSPPFPRPTRSAQTPGPSGVRRKQIRTPPGRAPHAARPGATNHRLCRWGRLMSKTPTTSSD